MRSWIFLASLMLFANTALAQTAGGSRGGNGDGLLLGTNAPADNVTRVGLVFELQTAPGAGSLGLGASATDFGVELTTSLKGLGSMVRYHASLTYSSGAGTNGFKTAPLGFGFAFPAFRQGPLRIEVEGVLSAMEFQVLSGTLGDPRDPIQGTAVNVSTGFFGQITASYGQAYVSLAPVGIDFSWFTIASGTAGGGENGTLTAGGFSAEYRFQLSGGVNF